MEKMTAAETKKLDTFHQCGGCGRYPTFLRRFANPHYFMVAFCMQNVLQGASSSYFVGVATSLEKHFHFTSKDIGNLVMLCEIGPITTSLIMSHLGGKGNRPRWLAMGMMISALGLLLTFSTCLLYPPPTISESGHLDDSKKFCKLKMGVNTTTEHQLEGEISGNCYSSNIFVFLIWLVAYACLGIGSSVVYSIGAPYLDDSIRKNDSPVYFAIIIAVKILGPFVGFAMSAAFLKIYVTPGDDHGISSLDPRWIGAWWGGSLLFCILNLLFGIIISLFPREMKPLEPNKVEPSTVVLNNDALTKEKPNEYGSIEDNNTEMAIKNRKMGLSIYQDNSTSTQGLHWITEFRSVVRRLIDNKAMMLTVWVDFFAILGITGFFLWLPKYLEHQFRVDKAESALYTGIAGTSSVIIGVLGGGLIIRQCRPKAKFLVQICATCKGLYIVSLIGMMFISCNFNQDLPGKFDQDTRILEISHNCSRECDCSMREFIPVCGKNIEDGKEITFFSPCHAGCADQHSDDDDFNLNTKLKENFYNCRCSSENSILRSGYCEKTCSAFTAYNLVNVVIKSFISVGLIGTLLINLRCVEPEDKAAALGLKGTVVALGLLGTPMVFGTLADSSCIVWEEACGTRGSCWVYDTQRFGYKLHGASALLFLASLIFEIILSRNVSHISLMDAAPPPNPEASRTTSTNTLTTSISSTSLNGDSRPVSIRNNPVLGSLRRSILKHLASSELQKSDTKEIPGSEEKKEAVRKLAEEPKELKRHD